MFTQLQLGRWQDKAGLGAAAVVIIILYFETIHYGHPCLFNVCFLFSFHYCVFYIYIHWFGIGFFGARNYIYVLVL